MNIFTFVAFKKYWIWAEICWPCTWKYISRKNIASAFRQRKAHIGRRDLFGENYSGRRFGTDERFTTYLKVFGGKYSDNSQYFDKISKNLEIGGLVISVLQYLSIFWKKIFRQKVSVLIKYWGIRLMSPWSRLGIGGLLCGTSGALPPLRKVAGGWWGGINKSTVPSPGWKGVGGQMYVSWIWNEKLLCRPHR